MWLPNTQMTLSIGYNSMVHHSYVNISLNNESAPNKQQPIF